MLVGIVEKENKMLCKVSEEKDSKKYFEYQLLYN